MKKILKFIGKSLLILVLMFIADVIINNLSFTDKIISNIYLTRFYTETEYVGEDTEWRFSFFSNQYRIKTYYDKENDFEFHLYFRSELYKNRVTEDDYYQYKLQKEAEDILVEEVLEPTLENDYFVVMKGFRDATRKNNLENSETVADIFTWSENEFDEIGTTVINRVKENKRINTDGGVRVYIFDNEEAYKNMVKYREENIEETQYWNMTHNINEEDFEMFKTIIYCYSDDDKWMNGQ